MVQAPTTTASSKLTDLDIRCLPFTMDGKNELRLVAIGDGELVGMVSVSNIWRPAATIYQLYVAPKHRKQGVAWSLVEMAATEAKERNAVALSAVVNDSDKLDGFYEKLGFSPVHHQNAQTLWSKRI